MVVKTWTQITGKYSILLFISFYFRYVEIFKSDGGTFESFKNRSLNNIVALKSLVADPWGTTGGYDSHGGGGGYGGYGGGAGGGYGYEGIINPNSWIITIYRHYFNK